MGAIFRSEHMSLVQILDRNDAAWSVVQELGRLGLVQLRDLNMGTHFYKRNFSDQVKRCDELSKWLNSLLQQIEALNLKPRPHNEHAPASAVSASRLSSALRFVIDRS